VSRLVCTFTVQGLLLGLPVADVQEVLREPEVTPIPGAPAAVRGLVNLRGDIIVATDLRRRLALPARTGDGSAMSLVVRTPDGPAALAADAPPETLEAHLRDLAVGVHELDDGLLVVLDAARAARTHEEPGAPA
jgi:purine-binding chemotaxis protein CheW